MLRHRWGPFGVEGEKIIRQPFQRIFLTLQCAPHSDEVRTYLIIRDGWISLYLSTTTIGSTFTCLNLDFDDITVHPAVQLHHPLPSKHRSFFVAFLFGEGWGWCFWLPRAWFNCCSQPLPLSFFFLARIRLSTATRTTTTTTTTKQMILTRKQRGKGNSFNRKKKRQNRQRIHSSNVENIRARFFGSLQLKVLKLWVAKKTATKQIECVKSAVAFCSSSEFRIPPPVFFHRVTYIWCKSCAT